MNWKTWLPLALALVLGLLAAKMGRDVLMRGRSGLASGKTAQIVIAKRDLDPGKAIGADDVCLASVADNLRPRNAFTDLSQVVGRVVVHPIVKDQAILETLLAPTGAGTGPQALVPAGMRAATVEVNEATGVGGLLAPGCHVDVVSTIQDEAANKRVTRTIVENVRVLAVGQHLFGSNDDAEAGARAKTVTLLVTPQQAELIELAGNTGRVRLVLRGALDTGSASGNGATLAELLGPHWKKPETTKPTEVALPQPVAPVQPRVSVNPTNEVRPRKIAVEVISAGKSSMVEFEAPKPTQGSSLTGDGMGAQPVVPGQNQ
jgi:pilus assembly protein CpaB